MFLLFLLVPIYIWWGFALERLNAWFLVEDLGAPDITIWTAVGILIIVGLCTAKAPTLNGTTIDKDLDNVVIAAKKVRLYWQYALLTPAICLAFGALFDWIQ